MNLEFTSWENGIDPATGAQVPGGMEAETRQALMFPDDMADSVITKAVYTELSLQEYPTRSPS